MGRLPILRCWETVARMFASPKALRGSASLSCIVGVGSTEMHKCLKSRDLFLAGLEKWNRSRRQWQCQKPWIHHSRLWGWGRGLWTEDCSRSWQQPSWQQRNGNSVCKYKEHNSANTLNEPRSSPELPQRKAAPRAPVFCRGICVRHLTNQANDSKFVVFKQLVGGSLLR